MVEVAVYTAPVSLSVAVAVITVVPLATEVTVAPLFVPTTVAAAVLELDHTTSKLLASAGVFSRVSATVWLSSISAEAGVTATPSSDTGSIEPPSPVRVSTAEVL